MQVVTANREVALLVYLRAGPQVGSDDRCQCCSKGQRNIQLNVWEHYAITQVP